MKIKFLFSLSLLAFLLACSSSNDSNVTGDVIAKINGAQKKYQSSVTGFFNAADEYVLRMEATNPNDENEYISFDFAQGQTGNNILSYFFYKQNSSNVYFPNSGVITYVEVNDGHKLKGTFSGTFLNQNSTKTIVGSFDIHY